MNASVKITIMLNALLFTQFAYNAAAEDKFMDREPQPSSYSSLCSFYRQADLPPESEFNNGHVSDFRSCRLENMDLSSYPESFADLASFNSSTTWPAKEKLPKGFSPDKILKRQTAAEKEINKIRKLARAGKGLSIGVIGKPILLTHNEYSASIVSYRQSALSPLANRESTAAMGMLAGKKLGFAPKASIYYVSPLSYGKTYGARDMFPESKALKRMLDLNAEMPANRRMKAILLLYRDYDKAIDGMETLGKAKKMAKEQNVSVFSGDDIKEFADYDILQSRLCHAASPAGNAALSLEEPGPELLSAWLAGLYLSALHYSPDLTKEDFFWLLKKTAAFPKKNSKNEKNKKKILRPLRAMEILRELQK